MPPPTRFRPSQAPAPRRVTRRPVSARKVSPSEQDTRVREPETRPDKPSPARLRVAPLRTLRARPWGVPVALAVLAVLLGGFAAWFAGNARHLRDTASAANTALTDNAATSAVNGQIASAVNTLFSYDYSNLDKTQHAADGMLVGNAVCEYDALFQVVKQQAPQQHLVVTVTVTDTGVEALTGDRARVLVFATQSSTSAVTKATSTAGAMFAVDAVRRGGRWRIQNIDTFTAGQTGGGSQSSSGGQSGSSCK